MRDDVGLSRSDTRVSIAPEAHIKVILIDACAEAQMMSIACEM
jgi:hypothetical protein